MPIAGPIRVANNIIINDFAAMTPLPRTKANYLYVLARRRDNTMFCFRGVLEAAFLHSVAKSTPIDLTLELYTFLKFLTRTFSDLLRGVAAAREHCV